MLPLQKATMLEQDLDDEDGFGNEDDVVSENKRLKDEQSK